MVKHPKNIKITVRKGFKTSGGVVKHPNPKLVMWKNVRHSEKIYKCLIRQYVVQVCNFTGSIELHIIERELTLPDELRYFVSYLYLCIEIGEV